MIAQQIETAPTTSSEAPVPAAAPRRSWRYVAAGKRDLRIDLLRGFAVFAMVVDHIGGHSWLYAITGGNRFFVSAAEAFVFISGVMVGLVYGGRARANGVGAVAPKILQRAWALYVLAVWLAILTALIATIFDLPGSAIMAASPARYVWEIVTVQRTFYLVDVMLLYFFLLLLSPAVLYLLLRGWWWLLLLISWGLWGAYQFFPDALQLPWPIAGNSVFKLASWQVLFFTGLLIGFARDRLSREVSTHWPRSPLRDHWLVPLTLILGGMIWLHVTDGSPLSAITDRDPAALLDAWFDKAALPPARLLASGVVFAFAWLVVTHLWRPIHAAFGWLLLPFGQAALYAYAAHLFLVPALEILVVRLSGSERYGTYPIFHPGVNSLIQAGALLVLLLLTRWRFLESVVGPMGQAPFIPWRRSPQARTIWRPSDGFALIVIVAALSAILISADSQLQAPSTQGAAEPSTSAAQSSGEQPPLAAQPVSTVTAPRRVGGPARGSTTTQPFPTPVITSDEKVVPAQSAPEPPHDSGETTSAADRIASESAAPSEPAKGYLLDSEIYSAALDRTMPYGIYLPPGYDTSTQHYPVLYMLHGSGGHYSEWINYGLAEIADSLIESRQIPPLIVVVPQGDGSYWINHAGTDGEPWGDYVLNDLIPQIDSAYRTIPEARARAIGGLSMGAFGALSLSMSRPDLFAVAGAHSPSLRTPDEAPEQIGYDAFRIADPVELATQVDPAVTPRIWLDVGDEDEWGPRVNEFHMLLRDRGIKHYYQVTPGIHDGSYWAARIPDYLRFYTSALAEE